MSTKLRRIELTNFRCFTRSSVTLTDANILVGPNNSGKSTIIDAIRCLGGAMRFARTRNPQLVSDHFGNLVSGFDVPDGSVPVSVANIANEYSSEPAVAKYTFGDQNSLTLQLHPERATRLLIGSPRHLRTRADFSRSYRSTFVIVPPLGPFEPTENFLTDDYVRQHESSRLAHRHFRNIWLRKTDAEFEEFRTLLNATWPDIEIERPTHYPWPENTVVMFFTERRIARELHWSGVGLQIWLQLLTHILLADSNSISVIDEPDIYLHPDLQKRLLSLLRSRSLQFITATHSSELINEAQNEDLMIVEKQRHSVQRINDIDGFQRALAYIGSNENVELSRLSRARRIVFFEGSDRRLLKRFARRLAFRRFVEDTDTLFLRLGGFSFWHRVESASWMFEEVLGTNVSIFALFDRDFRSDEEVESFMQRIEAGSVQCHILAMKEIENYLLVPEAIHKAICERLRARTGNVQVPTYEEIRDLLDDESNGFRSRVTAQMQAHRARYLRGLGDSRDDATIHTETLEKVAEVWGCLETRLRIVPGKEVLASLNRSLLGRFGKSVTEAAICSNISASQVDADLQAVLGKLENFCERR